MTRGIDRGSLQRENRVDAKFPSTIPFSPKHFNALIEQYGIRFMHEKASLCPNFAGPVSSGQHDLNCTLCENGFVHYDPKEILGHFSTNDMTRNYFRGGIWERGSAMLTVPSYYLKDKTDQVYVSFFDKFTLLDFEDRFYEVKNKAEGNIDRLRYKALKIEFLRTTKTEYKVEQHFVITDSGDIEWLTAERPSMNVITGIGEPFTVSYLYRPIYRVTEMLHEGRYSQELLKQPRRDFARFPQQMIIKKDFLIEKKDIEGRLLSEPLLP